VTWEITEWEYHELVDYFEGKELFWQQGDPGTWFRMNPPNEFGHFNDHRDTTDSPSFALQAQIPSTGRFKVVTLTAMAMNWTQEAVDAHITELLFKVTNMPFRLDVASFLEKELGHPAALAGKAAVIISRLQCGPLEGELFNVSSPTSPLGRYNVLEGGVFTFHHRGGQLGLRMQLHRPSNHMFGAFGTLLLEGHVRAVNGDRTENVVDWLTGAKEERDMAEIARRHREINTRMGFTPKADAEQLLMEESK
jgi:hypothetical protein